MAVTGMRLGEALNLERSDIDLTGGTLVIRNGKFGKSRQVPLHPSTAAALRDYDRNRARLLPTPTAANFLLSTVGTRLSDCRVESTFRNLVRRAGLLPRSPRCRPRLHDLRHTSASLLVRAGHSLFEVGRLLGHQDPRMTARYSHVAQGTTAAMVDRVMSDIK